MRRISTLALTLLATALLARPCLAQSLGEVARQERARKKPAAVPRRVITDEELRPNTVKEAPVAPAKGVETNDAKAESSSELAPAKDEKQSAAELQAKIKAQKQKVRELELKISELQKQLEERETIGTVTVSQQVFLQVTSLGSSYGLCANSHLIHNNPYKEWCEEPAKIAAEIEKTEAELAKERPVLEALQEQARRLGYGNAFYDPD